MLKKNVISFLSPYNEQMQKKKKKWKKQKEAFLLLSVKQKNY